VDDPNVVAGDSFNPNVDAIVEQVLRQAKDGGTVIFHLGGPNAPSTLAALRKVVPALEQRGYVFSAKEVTPPPVRRAPAGPSRPASRR